MNRRQSIIITIGVAIIVAICVYCLIEYNRIDEAYPKGTYKFEITTKTKEIRKLFYILGVYVIMVSVGTGSFAYIARSKSNKEMDYSSDVDIIEQVEGEVEIFIEGDHNSDDVEKKMRHLANLKDKGKINEDEYNKLVNEIFKDKKNL